ncbi:MAG: helix-turn-helix transcriptional regulator [Planctomycetota bacterium]
MKLINKILVVEGSDNVFADLDLPNADDLQTKAELTRQLYQRIKVLGLSQIKAAKALRLKQPDVSKLMNGRFSGFSVERLLELLNALAVDVDIVLRPGSTRGGHRGTVKVLATSGCRG